MKIRQHRGSFADSMATVAEIEPTMQAIRDHIAKVEPDRPLGFITVTSTGVDKRCGWDTQLIELTDGVFGYCEQSVHHSVL